ncbi:MAG: hypothetical protein GWN84_07420 [Gammaproteobacteria bacterium]|nr:hypothetical protein [Gammaproteobacteria bacterium]NIR82711.1 hypothetical protein [Gammaproteobacteria bacterium]NIR89575.1 hypothetical protein [Gammaproteobacteria bacterium]NIU03871.1 hypothetical protein [Gammaproteobacteria bacterium]NIV51187.1 hypothetical protein [Gammaproteobacteria bacterium]
MRPKLTPIPGTRERAVTIGLVRVGLAVERTPRSTDAVVHEEDTWRVLSSDTRTVRDPGESLSRVMIRALNARRLDPGSVLVGAHRPVRLLAVVYDFDQNPCWQERWIARALEGILHKADILGLRSLTLPLLGTTHGALPEARWVALLKEALHGYSRGPLTRMQLVASGDAGVRLMDFLQA